MLIHLKHLLTAALRAQHAAAKESKQTKQHWIEETTNQQQHICSITEQICERFFTLFVYFVFSQVAVRRALGAAVQLELITKNKKKGKKTLKKYEH